MVLRAFLGVLIVVPLTGCNVFNDDLEKRLDGQAGGPRECKAHADCQDPDGMTACTLDGRCVPLESEQCRLVAGDLEAPDAIVIGSLFSLTGAQAMTNLPRAQSVQLAVEELNAVGGVPGTGPATRPLVLVQCDEIADLDAAANHLVNELKVPAIVGPNVSQDVITVSQKYSIKGGTVLITPTAVASSISDLEDNDLTWQFIPSDEARAPLMVKQINELEDLLRGERPDRNIRLSIIHRNDALGTGTRVSLNDLPFNGMSLADNLSPNVAAVTIEPYGASDMARQMAIVDRQLNFAPDIVVMAGLAEAVTQIMVPLEQRWTGNARPYYVLIDSLKVPELLAAVSMNDDLRKRVRGTGIVPTARSSQVFEAFQVGYRTRFPDSPSTISGMGPSYDAGYAIAYALAATRDMPVSGASVAMGLRKLGGPGNGEPTEIQSTKILSAFSQLTSLKSLDALGTFAPLKFDAKGAPTVGRVEVWCIASGSTAQFASSRRAYDIATRRLDGMYEQCE
jgi:ABC-type branched-subunit amino acid transport system substrate-binding protein